MMRSLWAGVTGLGAHQIAMDVEGNNISNVNTTGFKYSRVNFANLLSQTSKIATAPQGELGGKNPMQVGLGTQVTSITTIYKQGSVQTTDKNTDLAIQGDGFFVVSPDGGQTYKYTRNGDFNFDAVGNFTDSNGYIIQGWMRDRETGEIDSTAPIRNITIPPGLTTPANDTTYITLKANLNSGNTIVNKKTIYELDAYNRWYDKNEDKSRGATETHNENSTAEDMFNTDKELTDRALDMGVLFNSTGEALNLRQGQGAWISYARAETSFDLSGSLSGSAKKLDIELNGVNITADIPDATDESMVNDIAIAINAESSKTGVTANVSGTTITLSNDNNSGTDARTKNIDLNVKNTTGADDTGLYDAKIITAYQYAYDPNSDGTTTHDYDDETVRAFKTTEDLRKAMQEDARRYTNYTGEKVGDGPDDAAGGGDDITWDAGATTDVLDANYNPGATVTVNSEGQFQIENFQNSTAFDPAFISIATSDEDFDGYLQNSDVTFPSETDLQNGIVIELPATFTGSIDITYDGGTSLGPFSGGDEIIIPAGAAPSGGIILDNSITLPEGTHFLDGTGGDPLSDPASGPSIGNITPPENQSITVNQNDGSADSQSMYLTISELTNSDGVNDVSANQRFVTAFRALQGALVEGGSIRTSQNLYAANHASSIDIYDSLGSKHTVRIEFTKTGFTTDGGTRWSMMLSVPEPGEINFTGSGLSNILTGEISFNSDGSLATYNPSSITYTANNGSTPNQNVLLDFGTLGQFDGMTSFDQQSNTSGISQDGYPGGDLAGIRVDETGTLIGSFTNGRSFGLAQVGMAKFTNNGGLESDGGNTFIQTSNSGDPIIGQANIGGRGFIQASSLEMSNVDLSRSLTQLIIVQRGYQANSKTITTSDQMLETLLQLKR